MAFDPRIVALLLIAGAFAALEVTHRIRPLPWYGRARDFVIIGVGVALVALGWRRKRAPDEKRQPPVPTTFDDSAHRVTDATADDTDLSIAADDRAGDDLDARAADRDQRLAELRARAERLRRGEGDSG